MGQFKTSTTLTHVNPLLLCINDEFSSVDFTASQLVYEVSIFDLDETLDQLSICINKVLDRQMIDMTAAEN